MRRSFRFAGSILCLLVGLCIPAAASSSRTASRLPGYGQLPLRFEKNVGQAAPEVRFVARGAGYALFFTEDSVVAVVQRQVGRTEEGGAIDTAVVRTRFADALRPVSIEPVDPLPGKSHYLLGNDPSKWLRDVQHYGGVRVQQIYDGVDLVYRGDGRQLEYDLVVKPGADPRSIHVQFEGAARVDLDGCGDIVLQTSAGALIQRAPVAYQEIDGERRSVTGMYERVGINEFSFDIGAFDRSKPLVIDPAFVYSTYLGGSEGDWITGIAVDGSGNAYVAGETLSSDFPTSAPYQSAPATGLNAFVAKINAAGSALLYSTYLGGSMQDMIFAIAVDSSGAYVTGRTDSANFPVSSAYQAASNGGSDAFVAKLSAAGSTLVYSTYFGGSIYENGRSIAVDGSGNAYVAGDTESADFPVVAARQAARGGGYYDGWVTKFNATGTPVFSTYLGGAGNDVIYGIALDSAGSAYVTGYTTSADFPTQSPIYTATGAEDAFVTKMNASGSALVYSTYLGGTGTDFGYSIAVDGSGNAYIAGETLSTDFPTTSAVQPVAGASGDAFVTKINSAGSSLVYSTYIGGNGSDRANSIAVDAAGSAYVTGGMASTDLTAVNAFQAVNSGGDEAFVAKLAPSGSSFTVLSYLGGDSDDVATAIALDTSADVYIAGSSLAGFPLSSPLQGSPAGKSDAFVAKLRLGGNAIVLSPSALPAASQCAAYSQAITASGGTPPYTFSLLSGALPAGMTLSPTGALSGTTASPGAHLIVVRATDASGAMGDMNYLLFVAFQLPAPTGLVATASSRTSVAVSWNAVASAAGYNVYRKSRATWTLVATPTTNAFVDTSVVPDTSYAYYVQAVSTGGCASAPSNSDFTTTTMFTDPDLAPGYVIRAVHLTELRTAANALKFLATGGSCTFAAPINAGATVITLDHLLEVRSCINSAVSEMTYSSVRWAEWLNVGSLIKASHFVEARNLVK